jgi:uncharacterized protein YdaL
MKTPTDKKLDPGLKNNPLVNYLMLFQNQHRIVSTLYRGLIISLSVFFIFLSFLVLSIMENQVFPMWGKVFILVIDLLLLAGIGKAFLELTRYKRKSLTVLNQVYEYLKNDLTKLEEIKSESRVIEQANRKLQDKVLSLYSSSKKPVIANYQGWDSQICPNCHAALEMLTEVCPQCHHQLNKTYTN